ncbi:MAG: 30S ribosomal protein S17 [Patescibacteria group bacterium]|nr:30S ribosomal protein S17 [Patescibacteria group bacterium]
MKGKVVKLKESHTAIVLVERAVHHKRYLKTALRHRKFLCMIPSGLKLEVGKLVEVREAAPKSKSKHWRVAKIYD